MAREKDITETGPKTLRGIRNPDLYKVSTDDPIDAALSDIVKERLKMDLGKAVYRNYDASTGRVGYSAFQDPSLFEPQVTSLDYGSSTYDKGLLLNPDQGDIQDKRANAQSGFLKIVNGLAKGAVLATTTFLDGTVGLALGAGTAISEGRWSGLWDNDFSKAMQAANEWSEKALPNYYTQDEQNNPWDHIFSANFIGDKFIKNLGFTVGALYGGGVISGGVRGVGKLAIAGAKRLGSTVSTIKNISNATTHVATGVGAFTSALNEGRIEALNNSKDWYNVHKLKLDEEYQQRIAALKAEYEANAGKSLKGDAEHGYIDPAYEKYKEGLLKEEEAYKQSLANLSEKRAHMGNVDLIMNLPILLASDLFQFSKFYANGFKTARKTFNIVGNPGNYTANTGKRYLAAELGKRGLAEGTEEISQRAASEISGDYYSTDVMNFYKSKTNREAEMETLDFMKSFADGIVKTVGDGSAWEEFLIGAMTGIMGVPKFRSMYNAQGKFQSPVTLYNEGYEKWKENKQLRADEAQLVDALNKRFNSEDFLNYYQGLIRHNRYQAAMNKAAQEGNEFDFKNSEHAQLVSDIIMFDKAGKLNDLMEAINVGNDTSEENLRSIVENTTAKDDSGKLIGPFAQYAALDSDGKIIANFGSEQNKKNMAAKLEENGKEITETIEAYRDRKDEFLLKYGDKFTDDQLSDLTWMNLQLDNWAKRSEEMTPAIKDELKHILGSLDEASRLNQELRDSEGREHADLTDLYRMFDSNVRNLSDLIQRVKSYTNLSNKSLARILTSNPKTAEVFIELIDRESDSVDKDDVVSKLRDMVKMGKAANTYAAKLSEYLKIPEKLAEDEKKADNEAAEKATAERITNTKDALSKATTHKEFRDAADALKRENPEESDNINQAIQDLANEGNQQAKAYQDINQYIADVNAALTAANLSPQTLSDASNILNTLASDSNSLEELMNPEAVVDDEMFLEEGINSLDDAKNRNVAAQYALNKAKERVNNGNKFKDRFSAAYQTPTDNERGTGTGVDEETTGDSKTPTIPDTGGTTAPTSTEEVPVGDSSIDDIKKNNKELNDSVEDPVPPKRGEVKQYYRPAVPELHIEASRRGDFRPFNVVASSEEYHFLYIKRKLNSNEKALVDRYISEHPEEPKNVALIRKALSEKLAKGNAFLERILSEPIPNFDATYNYLVKNDVFKYLNEGNLHEDDELGFMIDPEFEREVEGKEWHKKPTIFIINKRDGHIVGSLDESEDSVKKFEGLKELEDRIISEYNNKKSQNTADSSSTPDTLKVPRGYESATLKDGGGVQDSEELNKVLLSKNGHNIFQMYSAGRTFVIANINGVVIPFYMSAHGTDGKIAGNWYPFFGMTGTWLVKGSIDENGFMSYSPEIDRVTKLLNNSLTIDHKVSIKELAKNNNSFKPFTFKDRFKIPEGSEDLMFQGHDIVYGTGKRADAVYVEEITGIDASRVANTNKPDPGWISGNEHIRGILNSITNTTNNTTSPSRFIATPTTNVSQIMVGKVPYSEDERNLKDVLETYMSSGKEVFFGIIKKGVLNTNGKVDPSKIMPLKDTSGKEGRLYLLVPNGANKYSPVAVRVKHFNAEEFNPADVNLQGNPIMNNIQNAIKALSEVTSKQELDNTVLTLAKVLYKGNLHIDFVDNAYGTGIRFTKIFRDSNGEEIYEVDSGGNRKRKEEVVTVDLTKKGNTIAILGDDNQFHDVEPTQVPQEQVIKEITDALLSFNLPIQISVSDVNTSNRYKGNVINYNKGIIEAGLLTSNLTEMGTKSTWFTTDYFDAQGNPHKAINPVYKANPNTTTSSQGAISGVQVTSVFDNKIYFVDLQTNTIRDSGGKAVPTTSANEVLIDIAWAQKVYGDATEGVNMFNNKVITPSGKALDRTTQKYLNDRELQLLKQDIADMQNRTELVEKADRILEKINEDQSKVDKTRTDQEYYYILEDDGQYYPYERVHKALGPNWVGESTSNANSSRALAAGSAVDSIIRQYFMTDDPSTIQRPDKLTKSAFSQLLDTLSKIKARMEANGERFLTNNIVLYYKYSDGRRVAGEVDILAINKNGRYSIYDVKTSARSFSHPYFTEKGSRQIVSTKDYYTLQLSAYQNLFESKYDSDIRELGIVPFVLGYYQNTDVVNTVVNEPDIPIIYNPSVSVPLVDTTQHNRPKEEVNAQNTPNNAQAANNALNLDDESGEDDDILRLRETAKSPYEVWDREQELAWLEKTLPQLSKEDRLQFVKGLIKVGNDGVYAWGKFDKGIVTLSDIAAKGTVYHEAFHVVFNYLLDPNDRDALLTEYSKKMPNADNIDLEEALAEDFREFVMQGGRDTRSLGRKIIDFFKSLFIKTKYWKHFRPSSIYYFRQINEGSYANRKVGATDITRMREEEYTQEMKDILAKAPRDSQGRLLASNGKPSNLTERQYAQVRTKAFKNWFGDWERVANKTEEELQIVSLIFDRVPELAKIGTPNEYAAYIKEIFPNSVEKEVYWHGSNEDFSEGFSSAKKGEGSGALETKKRNDLYLNKQGWASIQYVDGINRKGRDKNGFGHWNKLWWELKEIMSNGRRENNDWKNIIIDESTIRQAIPNKKGVFNRDSGGKNGKWLSERKADYGYENKSDKEFFEEIFGIKLGKDTFNTWTARNAEIFKSLEKSAKGINPVVIDVRNPIIEEGQNTYYEEQRGLFTIANAKGNDAILSKKADNEFNSDVAVVINANNDNVYWLGTKSDIERFRQWKTNNNASKVVDENGEPLVVYHGGKKGINIFKSDGYNNIYFADRYTAMTYGYTPYAVFLNIKNPINIKGNNKSISQASLDYTDNKYIRITGVELNKNNADGVIYNNVEDIGPLLREQKKDIIDSWTKIYNNNGLSTVYVVQNPNQIKSATDNIGTFSTTNNDIRYRIVDEGAPAVLKKEVQNFLDNFGITIKEAEDFSGEMPLFDAVERVIYAKSAEDITEGTGQAIAFMMQHSDTMKHLIKYKIASQSSTFSKAVKRSLRRRGDYTIMVSDSAIEQSLRGKELENTIAEIGSDIARELRKLYNLEPLEAKPSTLLKKLWDVITEFFDRLTPEARIKFDIVRNYTRNIANSVKLNDPSIIRTSEFKPGTTERAELVDIEKALRDNPYEESIISILNSEGIALAGSASIALSGTLYRPSENPLHDLDFKAAGYTKEEISSIVNKHFPNNHLANVISKENGGATLTYLILDRPYEAKKDNSGIKITTLYDKETNEILGSYVNSELVLKSGVQGKFLDFFIGKSKYPEDHIKVVRNKSYRISDYRNAFDAKVQWARPKDIWDYNNFVSNDFKTAIKARDLAKEETKLKLQNARIIWAHPAIGKTTYLERNTDIIEWDAEVNAKRNEFFRNQIDPEHKMDTSSKEYKNLRSTYMNEWQNHPEYIEFLTKEWDALKRKAARENKRIFASPSPLMVLFMDDFDLFITLPEKTFLERNVQRGGTQLGSIGWKQVINRNLVLASPEKIIQTDKYFSEFMREYLGARWGTLNNEEMQSLTKMGWTAEKFDSVSQRERDHAMKCLT